MKKRLKSKLLKRSGVKLHKGIKLNHIEKRLYGKIAESKLASAFHKFYKHEFENRSIFNKDFGDRIRNVVLGTMTIKNITGVHIPTPAVAFKAKGKVGRYLCDGPDCFDWTDEDGDTKELSSALLGIRKDYEKPTEDDVNDLLEFLLSLPITVCSKDEFNQKYETVEVELSYEELEIIKERNGR